MSTGAIIAIAVVVVLILIALLVLMPRARQKAAERKAEQERRERERRLERERQEAAEQHRSQADSQRRQAELAEAEAKKQRAEADINAKRAELHEEGLADEHLASGAANGRTDHDRTLERDDGARQAASGGAVRDVSGGRAHEPTSEGGTTEYERGRERGHEEMAGEGGGSRRFTRAEDEARDLDQERRPAR
jgi:colicin import membrane protein